MCKRMGTLRRPSAILLGANSPVRCCPQSYGVMFSASFPHASSVWSATALLARLYQYMQINCVSFVGRRCEKQVEVTNWKQSSHPNKGLNSIISGLGFANFFFLLDFVNKMIPPQILALLSTFSDAVLQNADKQGKKKTANVHTPLLPPQDSIKSVSFFLNSVFLF